MSKSTSTTVSVGCKLPHGMHADVGDNRVTLNGSNSAHVIGGFGITRDVERAHIEKWMADHKDAPYVVNGLIFVMDSTADAESAAKAMEGMPNGFEGMDPTKPGKDLQPEDAQKLGKQLDEAQAKTAQAPKPHSSGKITKAPPKAR